MKQEFISVGTIVNAHGIRGEVKLNPVGFDPEFLAEFDRLIIGGRETEVLHARVHKSVVLLTLPGVEDMDAAHKKHEEMGCICFENPAMGIYFIEDPDGYWLEVVPERK